jgi:N-acetyl-gamma-glutamyl-phosphate reductase
MKCLYRIVLSGATGYSGNVLASLIHQHPYLHLTGVHTRQTQDEVHATMPILKQRQTPVFTLEMIQQQAQHIDVVLLATPAETSMEIVKALAHTTINIIDLSGAFRLPENEFLAWYNIKHTAPKLIDSACYGLAPWAKKQANHKLIANPGCYATCALMSLIPLLHEGIIQPDDIIIDAKSGVSGAGKKNHPELMFCEIANNFIPYKIGKHQHTPEINRALKVFTGKVVDVQLTTSLLPLVRGISMTIYAKAIENMTDDDLKEIIHASFKKAYQDYPFVRIQLIDDNDSTIVSLNHVLQTPYTHIGYTIKNGRITLFSCIDNLLKGAASQAIENINAMYHLPLHTGLLAHKEAP